MTTQATTAPVGFCGADTTELAGIETDLAGFGDRLEALADDRSWGETLMRIWMGPFAYLFVSCWESDDQRRLREIARTLRELQEELACNRREQETASNMLVPTNRRTKLSSDVWSIGAELSVKGFVFVGAGAEVELAVEHFDDGTTELTLTAETAASLGIPMAYASGFQATSATYRIDTDTFHALETDASPESVTEVMLEGQFVRLSGSTGVGAALENIGVPQAVSEHIENDMIGVSGRASQEVEIRLADDGTWEVARSLDVEVTRDVVKHDVDQPASVDLFNKLSPVDLNQGTQTTTTLEIEHELVRNLGSDPTDLSDDFAYRTTTETETIAKGHKAALNLGVAETAFWESPLNYELASGVEGDLATNSRTVIRDLWGNPIGEYQTDGQGTYFGGSSDVFVANADARRETIQYE